MGWWSGWHRKAATALPIFSHGRCGPVGRSAGRDLAQTVESPSFSTRCRRTCGMPTTSGSAHHARPRDLCSVERAPITRSPTGTRRSEVEGQDLPRPGNHPYNLALIAAMIAHTGEDATREWLKGLKANLAVKPSGNDRSQARASSPANATSPSPIPITWARC